MKNNVLEMSNIRDRGYVVEDQICQCHRCFTIIVYFFNFLIHLTAIGTIIFTLWLYYYNWEYTIITPTNLYSLSVYLTLFYAIAVTCNAIFACFAIHTQKCSRHFLLAFLICGCGVALICYIYKHFKQDFEGNISKSLQDAIIVHHSFVASKSYAIEKLHLKGRCCGAVDFGDWRNSLWWQNANNETNAFIRLYTTHVPNFCCKTITDNCGQSDHPSNIFYKGCSNYLKSYFEFRFWSIYGFLAFLTSVQLIGVLLEILLCIELKRYTKLVRRSMRYNGLLTSKVRHA